MTHLDLRLFGGFSAALDGAPVTGFDSDKVRALLAFLAVEADHAHRRERLAALLWPDYPDSSARTNLRNALANLRAAIGDRAATRVAGADPPFLWITRDTLQFNADSDAWVDVTELERAAAGAEQLPLDDLEAAAEAYTGDFLAGFTLADAVDFDDWTAATRERLLRRALDLLGALADRRAARGDLEDALVHARRRVDLAPWFEVAHRQCIRLLAAAGQRSAALRQYETCAATLQRELGARPSPQTEVLYEQIRLGTVAEPLEAEGLLAPERHAVGPCPYRGLAPFREADAPYFFGRDAFVARLEAALAAPPALTAVVGPSGSGKSSVVLAGLLPRLRESGDWCIVPLRPGREPFHALAGALLPYLEPEADAIEQLAQARRLSDLLARGELPVRDIVARIAREQPKEPRLLLLVDQFEELYTLCPDPAVRRGFVDALLSVAHPQRTDSPVAALLTLRADFMGQALAHRPFADALQPAIKLLGPMTRDELRAAIEKPAAAQGAVFERGLVARLLDDVGDQPGNLPLLEFALTLLWDRLDGGWITHAAYEATGEVEGALARYAQEVFDALSGAEQRMARRIFTQLVQPGEGTEDTRRVATRADLGDHAWALVQHLADRRLVVTGRSEVAGTETVEVVHEALIQHWDQLQSWMAEDRAFRTWQERLRVSLRTWEATDHDEGALLRGVPLAEAEGWLNDHAADLSPAELAFIEAGSALRERRAAEREAQRERELRQVVVGLTTEARNLMQGPNQDLALLLALEALEHYPYTWQAERALAELVLDWRLEMQFDHGVPVCNAPQVSPDETKLLTAANDGVLRVWDLATGKNALTLKAYDGLSANFHIGYWSPEGDRILTSALAGGRPKVWDATSGALILECATDGGCLAEWSPDGARLLSHRENEIAAIWDAFTGERLCTLPVGKGTIAAFSPDGRWVATSQGVIFDAVSGGVHCTLEGFDLFEEGRGPTSLDWSPDGRAVGAAGVGAAWIWDTTTGRHVVSLSTGYKGLARISWSPTGDRILVTGHPGDKSQAAIWDVASAGRLHRLPFHDALGHAEDPWTSDGDRVLLADDAGSVAIYEAESGRVVLHLLTTHGEAEATWLPGDSAFATVGSLSGQLRVWRTSTAAVDLDCGPDCPRSSWDGPNAAVWSPDGSRIARPFDDGSVRIWDVTSRLEIARTHRGALHAGIAVNHVAWSPDGGRLLTGAGDGAVEIWDAASGALQVALGGHGSVIEDGFWSLNHVVIGVAWSPDGGRALTCGRDRRAVIWDTTTGKALRVFAGREYHWGAWSPDSTRIVLVDNFGYGGPARIWNAATGEALLTLLPDNFAYGTPAVAWSPDGTQIVTFSLDEVGRLWDAETGILRSTFKADGFNMVAQWSPTGRRILCGGYNGVRVWDADSLQQIAQYPAGLGSSCGTWSPDGTAIAIGYANGDTKVYPAWQSTEELIAFAKAHCVLRELTPEERAQYGLTDPEMESGRPTE